MTTALPAIVSACLGGFAVQSDGPLPVLKRSDVVFMYQADVPTYRAFGAAAIGWGGGSDPQSIATSREAGILHASSVGMVTEFASVMERFSNYAEAICIDVEGNRLTVPWLWDHTHKGEPAYWFCTNSPIFREYIRQRVIEIASSGADIVHVDDHLGTAGNAWLGGCYCASCMDAFREFARTGVPAERLAEHGVADAAELDYRKLILDWLAEHPEGREQRWLRPLAHEFQVFQSRAAADFMMELRELAAETAGRPVPMSANAGVESVAHLSDYRALDYLSCEVGQGSADRKPWAGMVLGYKMAEALGRMVAATASGHDWALVSEESRDGLVRIWIAQAYALGQIFMAPHHQWCYTQEKGTHWYDPPAEDYAPTYRFIREHAGLFDGYETATRLGLVVAAAAQRQWRREAHEIAEALTATNVPFRVLLGGDDMLPCELGHADLAACDALVVPNRDLLAPRDAAAVEARLAAGAVLLEGTPSEIAAAAPRPIRVESADALWAVPRVLPDDAGAPIVVHLVNLAYDAENDESLPTGQLSLVLDLAALGRAGAAEAIIHEPGQAARPARVEVAGASATITVDRVGTWALVEVR